MRKSPDYSKIKKCDGCSGTGWITSFTGSRPEKIICPACNGKKYVKKEKTV